MPRSRQVQNHAEHERNAEGPAELEHQHSMSFVNDTGGADSGENDSGAEHNDADHFPDFEPRIEVINHQQRDASPEKHMTMNTHVHPSRELIPAVCLQPAP